MLIPTLLSLSLLTVMSGAAVAPALARIAAAFPEASATMVKLVLTLPSIFIIIFSFLSGQLSIRFSKRHILLFGLLFYLLGGVGGGFATTFEYLLISRAILGIGVGLIMPLSTGLIADFYFGEERSRLMGYSTASSNLGGIIATLAAGKLAMLSWRFSFGVYLLGLLVFLLVLFFLPEPGKSEKQGEDRKKLSAAVYFWGGATFVLMLAFYAIPINLAIFLDQNRFGDSSSAGLAISLVTASGFVGGLTFAKIQSLVKSFLNPLLLGLIAVGYFILYLASGLPQVLFGSAIVGLGLGWALPALYIGATTAAGDGLGVQAMAVVSSLAFFGQFMSPIVLSGVGEIFGDTSIRFAFAAIALCFSVFLLLALLSKSWTRRRT